MLTTADEATTSPSDSSPRWTASLYAVKGHTQQQHVKSLQVRLHHYLFLLIPNLLGFLYRTARPIGYSQKSSVSGASKLDPTELSWLTDPQKSLSLPHSRQMQQRPSWPLGTSAKLLVQTQQSTNQLASLLHGNREHSRPLPTSTVESQQPAPTRVNPNTPTHHMVNKIASLTHAS